MNVLERLEKEKAEVKNQIKTLDERLNHLTELESIVTKAMEDEINIHSHLHVQGKKEFPYRIKTWDELLETDGVDNVYGDLCHDYHGCFKKEMRNICGKLLLQNILQECHDINRTWAIYPWMITENT